MDKTAAIGRDEALDLVRQYKRVIAKHFSVEPQVMLFGSYSKGTANKDSDIDVAVIVPSYGDRKLELSKALWHDVDAVSLLIEPVLISKEFPSPLYDDVMRTGIAV
ncbi:MAG: nucleotidyltransferase domain-containing protein [Bacteroidales bacterium]|nr:nucleotidyltransferase domain-containing protein [Bacteroidales bacterium]